MSQPKPNPCRLCGGPAYVIGLEGPVWNVGCEPCGLVLFGGEEVWRRTMVERWNRLMALPVTVDPQLVRDLRNPPANRIWADLMAEAADVLEGRRSGGC